MPDRFVPLTIGAEEWDRRIARYPDLSLVQTGAYGEARAAQGEWRVERGMIERDGREVAAAQALVRTLPVVGGGLAWIGRGPLGADAASLDAVRRHFVEERGLYLRVAPPVASPIMAQGFRATESLGWASAVVDLAQDLTALRAGLEQKWRNGLNKAERSGAVVERSSVADFVAEYREFVAARGFATSVTPELLTALDRNMPLLAYRAHRESVPLGSALIARYGDCAEYLAGTLLEAGREHNAGQMLLWRAVMEMKGRGLKRFDVGGMDEALTPKGIYDFKSGLGGTPYRHANELEADDGGMRARVVRWRVQRARAL
jgi:lipid II:glycine glycyltransferase (peptidoglycan interpeptide bridge formation enzyme)